MNNYLFLCEVLLCLLGICHAASPPARIASPPELLCNVTVSNGGVKGFDIQEGIVYVVGDFGLITFDTNGDLYSNPTIVNKELFDEKSSVGYSKVIVSSSTSAAILISDTYIAVINITSDKYDQIGNISLALPVLSAAFDESDQILFLVDSFGLISIRISELPYSVNITKAYREIQQVVSYSESDKMIVTASTLRFSLLQKAHFLVGQDTISSSEQPAIKNLVQTKQKLYFTTTANVMFVNKIDIDHASALDNSFQFERCVGFDVTDELISGVNRTSVLVHDPDATDVRLMSRVINLNNNDEGIYNIDIRSRSVSTTTGSDHMIFVLDTNGFQMLNGSYTSDNKSTPFPWLIVAIASGGTVFVCILFYCCRVHLARSRDKSKDFKQLFKKNYGDPSASVREMSYYESM